MGIGIDGGLVLPRGRRLAKGGLTALLALFLVALMAGPAEAGTPAYSLSVKYAEGGSTPLYNARGVATDSAGNVYVTTELAGKSSVQKFSAAGKYLAKFGSSSGPGTCAEPVGVDVDSSGNVWVACRSNKVIIEFSAAGSVLKEVSTSALGRPFGVAVDGSGGVWWLARESSVAWKFDSTGKYVAGISVVNGNGIDVDPTGNLWITRGETVSEYSSVGSFIRQWNPAGGYSYGISADASGNLWIAHGSASVNKYSPLGVQLDKFGSYGTGVGQFLGTSETDGVAVGPEGAIWAANPPHNEVEKWVPTP